METNLKRIREEKNLSQRELSEQAGISLRTLQAIEQGQRDINGVKVLTALKLAAILECNVRDILEI